MRFLLTAAVCAALAVSVGCVSKAEFGAFREEAAKTDAELREQITDLQGKLKAAETALKDQIAAVHSEVGGVKTDLGAVKTDVNRLKEEIGGIKTLVTKAQGLFIKSMENMAEMYKRQYEAIREMLEKESVPPAAPGKPAGK